MPILPADRHGIDAAVQALAAGRVVGLPTETVYGLAADATSPDAITRVFTTKGRPLFDPLIVHLPAGPLDERLRDWATPAAISRARALLEAAWPGPLTVVLDRAEGVLDLVTSGLPTVALRMPVHPVAQQVLARFGPLVAPSANRFGRISPTTARAVADELGDILVLDGGACDVGVESTVVHIPVEGPVTLLRPGGMARDTIEAITGPLARAADPGSRPTSPGQLASHYAPRTRLFLAEGPLAADPRHRGAAVLAFGAGPLPGALVVRDLGRDPRRVARDLFATLRELDALGAPHILVDRFPDDEGLGAAILDRLRRAAAPVG